MSKSINIFTGERCMTSMNAYRYYASKANKAYKKYDYELCRNIWHNFLKENIHDCQNIMCNFCTEDDFGYCGQRKSTMSD